MNVPASQEPQSDTASGNLLAREAADEAVLIELAIAGEYNAFHQLMKRYNQRLYRAARSILHNDNDAEDAVQQAWWKAFQHLVRFRREARFGTWLTRIAVNEALMLARRNRRRLTVIQPWEAAPSSSAALGPDQEAWRSEVRALLEQHINALPEIYRVVFVLRAIEDLPSTDIADILELPDSTIRVRYMRARRQLRQTLRAGAADFNLPGPARGWR